MPNKPITRSVFLKQSAAAVAAFYLPFKPSSRNLAFSTLGCPDWDLARIVQFAQKHGYKGLELRGIGEHMFLPDSPYLSGEKLKETKRMIREAGLKIVSLGSSAQMHHTDAATAAKNLDEARKYLDLAAQLDCPFIRVFPEKVAADVGRQAALDLIKTRMAQLGEEAGSRRVTVLVESHGDLVRSADLKHVLGDAGKHTGMIWDVVNMWSVTKEPPAEVFAQLKPFIHHVHLKDVVWEGDKMRYVLFGKGVAPVKEAVALLQASRYKGYYSFEWEKRWHPEIEAPEVAIAQFPEAISTFFK